MMLSSPARAIAAACGQRAARPARVIRVATSDRAAGTRMEAASSSQPTVSRRLATLGAAAAAAAAASGMPRNVAAAAASSSSASEMEQVLIDPKWPEKWPFRPQDFGRYDESPDTEFYNQPRFVTHIDDNAIAALTKHYAAVLPAAGTPGTALLDMCSSWISHYPEGYRADKIVGLGMNEAELKRNTVLTEYVVRDLNTDPALPFEDNSFDVITNAVSVDYLNKPLEIFREMHRVLKPGGTALMSFSNRCFPTKAIQLWTATGDADHIWIVGSYFHYAVPGGFTEPRCADISPKLAMRTDPMYVVYASKKAA